MSNVSQKSILLLLVAMFVVGLASSSTCADEDFDSAFSSTGLPWYDSKTKDLVVSKAPKRKDSTVADRNRIPTFKKKRKGQRVQNNPAPPPAAATGGTGFATVGTTVMYILGGLLAIALVVALIYGFLKLESNDAAGVEDTEKRKRKIRDHIKHLPFDIEEQDGDFESFAEKSFRNGDYSNAVIYLFADLLVTMSESGLVRLQRGKTNRQYLNEIWDHNEIRPYYRKVMTAFEDAFFGKHVIEKSRAEECFAGRASFDVGVEEIRKARFAAQQNAPITPSPNISVEGIS